jgi:UDP-N-acetylmuramoyl-tripeptide--D-alanyl-D-alanine ligase
MSLRSCTRPWRDRIRREMKYFKARLARSRSKARVVAVTGSSAKSTTSALLAHIMRGVADTDEQVLANTLTDIIKAVRRERRSTAFTVIEAGVSKRGDMDRVAPLLRPDIAIVTHVGLEHYASFRSSEAIAQEKGKLVAAVRPGGAAVLNADEPLVLEMASRTRGKIVTFGRGAGADCRVIAATANFPERLRVTLAWRGSEFDIQTRLVGEQFWVTVAACFCAASELGAPPEVIIEKCASFEPIDGRCAPVVIENGPIFIVDCVKAPWSTLPLSYALMKNARAPYKRIVLGQIADFPGNPRSKYRDAYRAAAQVCDQVIFVGPNSHRSGASSEERASGRFVELPSVAAVSDYVRESARPGELILLKSSKNLHLERIALSWRHEVRCWAEQCGLGKTCVQCGLHSIPHEQHARLRDERAQRHSGGFLPAS